MRTLVPWRRGGGKTTPALAGSHDSDPWLSPFDDVFSAWGAPLGISPKLDIREDEREVEARLEVPGMSKDDLQVTWDRGALEIKGEKREETRNGRHYQESRFGSFSRSVPLGPDFDWERAKATSRDGVLTVTLPKSKKSTKQVVVKVK